MNKETLNKLIADLIEYAANPGYSHGDYADTMRQAAAALAERTTLPAHLMMTDEQQRQVEKCLRDGAIMGSVSDSTVYVVRAILAAAAPAAPYPTRECAAEALTPSVVTCQIYGHVVGHCAECNVGAEHGELPPIPVGVCFSEQSCNFYRADTGEGMGDEFYDKWRDRADEFPDRATARAAIAASKQAAEPVAFVPPGYANETDWLRQQLADAKASIKAHQSVLADKPIQQPQNKPNTDCSGDPKSCPDNEGYGCACDPMNKAASANTASCRDNEGEKR